MRLGALLVAAIALTSPAFAKEACLTAPAITLCPADSMTLSDSDGDGWYNFEAGLQTMIVSILETGHGGSPARYAGTDITGSLSGDELSLYGVTPAAMQVTDIAGIQALEVTANADGIAYYFVELVGPEDTVHITFADFEGMDEGSFDADGFAASVAAMRASVTIAETPLSTIPALD